MKKENGLLIMITNFRIIYLKDYTIKTLRIKPDKWTKLCNSDEVKHLLGDFVTTGSYRLIYVFK